MGGENELTSIRPFRSQRQAARAGAAGRAVEAVESGGGVAEATAGGRLVSRSGRHGVAGQTPIGLRRAGASWPLWLAAGRGLASAYPGNFPPLSVSPSLSPRSHILPPPVAVLALLNV